MPIPDAGDGVDLGAATLDSMLALVVADDEVRGRLRSMTDRDAFAEAMVAEAASRGWRLTAADVDDALRMAKRRRLERWV